MTDIHQGEKEVVICIQCLSENLDDCSWLFPFKWQTISSCGFHGIQVKSRWTEVMKHRRHCGRGDRNGQMMDGSLSEKQGPGQGKRKG